MSLKKSVKPLKQRELDRLCGVYLMIYAQKYLFPKDKVDLEDLFRFILTKIDKRNKPKLLTVILNGMGTVKIFV